MGKYLNKNRLTAPLYILLDHNLFSFRQHVIQWRRIHPQLYRWQDVPNIGTQATLYNITSLKIITERMGVSGSSKPLDIEISNQRKKLGFTGYLLEPNLVRHIGISSSLDSEHQGKRDNGDMREFMSNYCI